MVMQAREFVRRVREVRLYEVQKKLALASRLAKELKATQTIQRVIRGGLGRLKAKRRRAELEAMERRAHQLPVYYRLKQQYYRDLTLFHRTHALKIQCLARRRAAVNRVRSIRGTKAARKIQHFLRGRMTVIKAKETIHGMKQKLMRRNRACIQIQRIARGLLARRYALMNALIFFRY